LAHWAKFAQFSQLGTDAAKMLAIDMQEAETREIGALPQRTSSEIKHNWGSVARQAREVGRVAITTHRTVELVVMSVDEYSRLMTRLEATRNRERAMLDDLKARFDQRLACLRATDADTKADAFFAARGKTKERPLAGSF
jgi:PHD/YefM family antitoxin component YafN of YafNO toxin-antitoxin module